MANDLKKFKLNAAIFLSSSALIWLVVYSIILTLSGFRILSPGFLADLSFLSYGRLDSASSFILQYGFLVQFGLAVMASIFCLRGNTVLVDKGFVYIGGIIWNLGVTIGLIGILTGQASGLSGLQMPSQSIPVLIVGFILVSLSLIQTNNRRSDGEMMPENWFFLISILWFPWILGGAYVLLYIKDVNGVLSNIVDWWFINNFYKIYLTFVSIGILLHFINTLLGAKISRMHIIASIWILLLSGSIGGVSPGAPVPAWMPALSTVMSVFYFFGIIILLKSIYDSIKNSKPLKSVNVFTYSFLYFSIGIFALVSILNFIFSFPFFGRIAEFTFFVPSVEKLFLLGFCGTSMFLAYTYVTQNLTKLDIKINNFKYLTILLILGVLLSTIPSAITGLLSGDGTLTSGLFFVSIGNSMVMFGSILVFFNLLKLLYLSFIECDCIYLLKGKKGGTDKA